MKTNEVDDDEYIPDASINSEEEEDSQDSNGSNSSEGGAITPSRTACWERPMKWHGI